MNEFYKNVQNLMFENVDDLYSKKMQIREKYALLDYSTKQIYKWFFYYQLCLLRNPLKRLLWDFISGSKEISIELDLTQEYRKFCEKRKKMYPSEEEDTTLRLKWDMDSGEISIVEFDNYD